MDGTGTDGSVFPEWATGLAGTSGPVEPAGTDEAAVPFGSFDRECVSGLVGPDGMSRTGPGCSFFREWATGRAGAFGPVGPARPDGASVSGRFFGREGITEAGVAGLDGPDEMDGAGLDGSLSLGGSGRADAFGTVGFDGSDRAAGPDVFLPC